MSKLLVLYTKEITTVSGLKEAYPILLRGTEVQVTFEKVENLSFAELNSADSILIVRETSFSLLYIVRIARKAGFFIGVFFDDDMLFPPKSVASIPWVRYSSKRCVKLADFVLSSNPHLAHKYAEISRFKRGCVLHTPVRKELINQIPKGGNVSTVKIVYAAGPAHDVLFLNYIKPVLHKLDKRYGNQISLTFVGVKPDLSNETYSFKIDYKEGMPLEEYRKFMREQCFHIGLAPLNEDEFSSCKYFNKFIEYTIVGVVGIYTKCRPYTYVVRDRVNGFLADNTDEAWFKKICEAIDDKEKRLNCLETAIDYLKREHNVEVIKEKLLKELPELKTIRKKEIIFGNPVIFKSLLVIDRVLSLAFYSVWEIRHEGLGWVIRRIKFHLSEGRGRR